MKLYIKETAKKHGITITELSERLDISITALSTIINNQSGKTYISTLQRIANAIGCNISELLGEQPGTTITAGNSVINIHNDTSTHETSVCPWCGHKIDVSVSIDKGSE